jgi:methanogenic corrinoid protein MtbC1
MDHISKNTIDQLIANLSFMAKEVVEKQFELQPELKKYGESGFLKSLEDGKYNLQYLLSAVDVDSISLFEQYIKWVNELMINLNLPNTTIEVFYNCTKDIIKEKFENGIIEKGLYEKITLYIHSGISYLKSYSVEIEECYDDNPYKTILDNYSKYVLSGNKKLAVDEVINLANRDDVELQNIYKYILQPFQLQIGNLWHQNKINVGKEHYATAVSQYVMSMLYDKIFSTPKNNKIFLGTCVEGELHEIGIRMICDFIESCGWNTYYLGANMPSYGVVQEILDKKPNVIGISCTMSFNIHKVKGLIKTIKERGIHTPIIVGGYPFTIDEKLWSKVGADGCSRNFDEVNTLIEGLCEVRL